MGSCVGICNSAQPVQPQVDQFNARTPANRSNNIDLSVVEVKIRRSVPIVSPNKKFSSEYNSLINMRPEEIGQIVPQPKRSFTGWTVPCVWPRKGIYDGDTAKIIFYDHLIGENKSNGGKNNKYQMLVFRFNGYDSAEMRQKRVAPKEWVEAVFNTRHPKLRGTKKTKLIIKEWDEERIKRKNKAIKDRDALRALLLNRNTISIAKITGVDPYKRLLGDVYLLTPQEWKENLENLDYLLTADRSVATKMIESGNGYAYEGGTKQV
jgi:hypothetical protein